MKHVFFISYIFCLCNQDIQVSKIVNYMLSFFMCGKVHKKKTSNFILMTN